MDIQSRTITPEEAEKLAKQLNESKELLKRLRMRKNKKIQNNRTLKIGMKLLTNTAIVPALAHPNDACYDIFSDMEIVTIQPKQWALIQTGIAFAIPTGWEGLIRPRSGNALNSGITVLNTPGTIDSNYRGEVGVILYNANDIPVKVYRGDRIAQIAFRRVPKVELVEMETLDETDRGTNGFGSTGK